MRGGIETLDQFQTRASWRLLLQPLAVLGQALGLLAHRPLGRGETLRQRAIETLTGLLALHRIEAGRDPRRQLQTERLASEQLSEALLFGFSLPTLQQRRTLFAQQMDTGEFEQRQQGFGRGRLGPYSGRAQQ